MNALELSAPSEFHLVEKPQPVPQPDEVLIRVRACGICGSDVHGMDNSSGRRIPPMVMGHEASGEIVELGAEVTGWQVGDRVSFDSMVWCGHCENCQAGRTNLCESREVMGVSCAEFKRDGAFADFVAVPTRILEALPDGLAFEEAAFTEPLAVALHAVKVVRAAPGESALVVGAGLIGLLVIQALKKAGCREIIAVDLDQKRLDLARDLGATVSYLATELPELEVDLALEVVGATPTVQQAIASVKKGGRVGLVGNVVAEVTFPLQAVVTREIEVLGCCAAAAGDCREALDAIASGEVQVRPLISAQAPLQEGHDWFHRCRDSSQGLLKVILQPG